MSNEVGSSNQKPEAPLTNKQRVKLFFSSVHTWLLFIIFSVGIIKFIFTPEWADGLTWTIWCTLCSILFTLKVGIMVYDKKKKTY